MQINDPKRYSTKQMSILTKFFHDNKNTHFTADEVYDNVRDSGISRATVYRRIEQLVEEGLLVKYTLDSRAGACYQYCCDEHKNGTCHFVCTQCKAIKHIDCSLLSDLQSHLNEDHGLNIDSTRTVFYGVCGGCKCKD